MILNNFLLIALRYLCTNQKDAAIRSMIRICFIGICIATCALTVVMCVMQGFEQATYQRMQSIYPDLILDTHGNQIDTDMLQPILQESSYHITHSSEQRLGQALLYNPDYDNPIVIFLRGIQPEQEELTTNLISKTIQPQNIPSLSTIIHDNHIFIGQKLAQQLQLSMQDEAKLLYSQDEIKRLTVTFQQLSVTIGGIFKTGIDDFDTNLVLCSAQLFDQLFPDQGATQIYIKLDDRKWEHQTSQLLQQRLNVDVYSWKSLYPALVSALKLEKWAMFLILFLIIVIASMNSISLLFMYITQKKKEIALLMCFGMPLYKIKLIFLCISLAISFSATVVGLGCAYLLGLCIQHYPIIALPEEAYITNYLPIQLDLKIFCVIFISSLILGCIAMIISTRQLKNIALAQTLKYE